jgi:hypothetical protein
MNGKYGTLAIEIGYESPYSVTSQILNFTLLFTTLCKNMFFYGTTNTVNSV